MAKKQSSKGKRTKKAAKPAASESMAARRRKARMKQRSGTKPRSPAGPTVLIHRDPKLTTPHGVISYEAINRLHWENRPGGHGGTMDGVFLAGYVWCNQIPNLDDFPHNCKHGSSSQLSDYSSAANSAQNSDIGSLASGSPTREQCGWMRGHSEMRQSIHC